MEKSQSYLGMFEAALGRHPEAAAGNLLLLAVSGGADSTALFYGALELSQRMGFCIAVCHVNHGIRGAEADSDEAFVADLCKCHNIPLHIKRLQFKAGEKVSEDALRQERLKAICACVRETDARAALLAHQRDDLAETFLMRLLRGGGLRGLGGFHERTKWDGIILIHPLRDIPRFLIFEYLESQNLKWREDSTNSDLSILRNRIRRQVLPFLRREIEPDISETFAALANHFGELYDYVIHDASELFHKYLQKRDSIECLNLSELDGVPDFILSEMLRLWMCQITGAALPPSRKVIETLMRTIRHGQSGELLRFGGGVMFYRDFSRVMGFKTDISRTLPKAEILNRLAPLLIPIQNQELGLPYFKDPRTVVSIERENLPMKTANLFVEICPASEAPPESIALPLDKITFPLTMRTRSAGDKINIYGITKPLKKWFIEKKIPTPLRDHCAIIADQKGLLWAPEMFHDTPALKESEMVLCVMFEA